ncbi:MAG: hypothetical protein GY801_30005 [bacterium]|nr:hypothetical protein [bacterium]
MMSQGHISYSETVAVSGEPLRLVYHEEDDMLEVFFGQNEPATGVELTDHILLRLNRTSRQAVSLTLRHFSILAEHTLYGPRSYPLDHLDELPESLHEIVLRLLTSPPVNQFLKLSHVQLSSAQQMPVAYVEPFTSQNQAAPHHALSITMSGGIREASKTYQADKNHEEQAT